MYRIFDMPSIRSLSTPHLIFWRFTLALFWVSSFQTHFALRTGSGSRFRLATSCQTSRTPTSLHLIQPLNSPSYLSP
ncbi:hypothetical protein DFH08DRAFT_116832 [Mycena albidolilacea]|uniref:Uncharacterized protein n=1 Tax=Mycena albidolilacea TaxID=1033008 RepID=A0AAD7A7Q3_9AGAR|nr:hypothetical protein DFH08DRAFT_116832 [Mycena albidolilacea]